MVFQVSSDGGGPSSTISILLEIYMVIRYPVSGSGYGSGRTGPAGRIQEAEYIENRMAKFFTIRPKFF